MAKATPLSPSTHCLVAQAAPEVISASKEVDRRNIGPINARSGVFSNLSWDRVEVLKDLTKELHDILTEVHENAWQEMEQNLAPEDRLVLARMPQGLNHTDERWHWFNHCPGFVGAKEVARKCLFKEMQKSGFSKWWEAKEAEWNALSKEVV